MNFQQLRSALETVQHGFNLTTVARTLQTSQPGVSRQIRELEEEIGTALFVRCGRRLTGLTASGRRLLPLVERILRHEAALRRAGQEAAVGEAAPIRVAATDVQARHVLPPAVHSFRQAHPDVPLQLRQGTAAQIAQWLAGREVDIGLGTDALASHPGLETRPCHAWSPVALVPPGHPLAGPQPLTLARLAQHPLLTHEPGFSGLRPIDAAFAAAGLQPEYCLRSADTDLIKASVGLGLGVGLIASIAWHPVRDAPLLALPAQRLFGTQVSRLAVRRGAGLTPPQRDLLRALAPSLAWDAALPSHH